MKVICSFMVISIWFVLIVIYKFVGVVGSIGVLEESVRGLVEVFVLVLVDFCNWVCFLEMDFGFSDLDFSID